jgi:predicted GNAT superfamily acetyltransferase
MRDAALPDEAEAILALNNAAVPEVNAIDGAMLDHLAAIGRVRVAAADGQILAVLVTLPPGQAYDSLNYAWFSARYDDFLYIDRVVVAPDARGSGIGRLLYEDAIVAAAAAGRPFVLSEVNVDPPNPASLAFHERLGFRQVAERLNEREGKTVAMMERAVPATPHSEGASSVSQSAGSPER